MITKTFTSGRIRRIDYDANQQQLELHWVDKSVLAYHHVPAEVVRRLCAAPNPAAYWEDRIADEYPKGTPQAPQPPASSGKSLSDLFGEEA
ncbi:MAG: KTSC domain-containing protein [Rhodoferax sp.]|uniref:KTSC domain-containing protein n=1 Tax=Rhodoferax sp. TaxID=50421 RepID=UPI001B6F80E5|nr:KTSC domain-containing protein [Rhodoferax sp.]MBP9907328.1 KTSC domain-containing protein [Rhodoferax sp.]